MSRPLHSAVLLPITRGREHVRSGRYSTPTYQDQATATHSSHDRQRSPVALLPSVPARFRVLEEIGQGGMGIIHRAFDTVSGRDLAIKSLKLPRPDDFYRLKREFRTLRDLRHHNLIRLYELFATDANTCFFSMELIAGTDFVSHARAPARAGCLAEAGERLLDAARQLAEAIAAVHQAAKLHRDIKPSNVMVCDSGRVVLLDFGLAASLSPHTGTTSAAGTLIGTRGHVAPEQARGEPLSCAADWYSFGIVLHQAVTGHVPRGASGVRSAPGPGDVHRGDNAAAPRLHVAQSLETLIADLLHPLAHCRPDAGEILARLGQSSPPRTRSLPHFAAVEPHLRAPRALHGVGSLGAPVSSRTARTLAASADFRSLQKAFAVAAGGSTIVVRLCGPQGAATSAASAFTDQLEQSGALVLRGRCEPTETVAYNALDGIVDDLSHALEHMSHRELLAVAPPDIDTLPRLFPILGRLEAMSGDRSTATEKMNADGTGRARQALRDLLARLADQHPLVIWVDNVHLGDRESGELFRDLLSAPDAAAIMVLLSGDTTRGLTSPMLQSLDTVSNDAVRWREVHVGREELRAAPARKPTESHLSRGAGRALSRLREVRCG